MAKTAHNIKFIKEAEVFSSCTLPISKLAIVRSTLFLQEARCKSTYYTLLEHLTNDVIAQLYVTKFSTISLNLPKLFVTQSFAVASSVIHQFFPNCVLYTYRIILGLIIPLDLVW